MHSLVILFTGSKLYPQGRKLKTDCSSLKINNKVFHGNAQSVSLKNEKRIRDSHKKIIKKASKNKNNFLIIKTENYIQFEVLYIVTINDLF